MMNAYNFDYGINKMGTRIRNLLVAALLTGAVSACSSAPDYNSSGIGHVPASPSVQTNPGELFNMNGNLIY